MKDTNNSKEYIKAKYNEMKQIDEVNEEDSLELAQDEVSELKNKTIKYAKIYAYELVEKKLAKEDAEILESKIVNVLMKLDKRYDIFVDVREKALKSAHIQDKSLCLSSADGEALKKCVKEVLDIIIEKYKENNKFLPFWIIFKKIYYEKLKILSETRIKEIRALKIEIEKMVKDYVCDMVDEELSVVEKEKIKYKFFLRFFLVLDKLDEKYDVFSKFRLKALKDLKCYNKKLHFKEADISIYYLFVKKILDNIINEYKKNGIRYSFISAFEKNYTYNMKKAIQKFYKDENIDYKWQINSSKKEIRNLVDDLFKDDEKFNKAFKEELRKLKSFNYHEIKCMLIKNIIKYVSSVYEENINNNIYNYINKEDFQEETSEEEIKYIIQSRAKQDFGGLKRNLKNIIDKLYTLDCSINDDKFTNNEKKYYDILQKQLSKINAIDIDKLKNVDIKLLKIESCLDKIEGILNEKVFISILQKDENGKEYSILERRRLRAPDFIDVKEKFFSYMDIYDKIKGKLTKASQKFFAYIFKYIILEYRRRDHNDMELYDYVKDDKDFINYYEKSIPKNENPNYIETATEKKYDLVAEEKIIHKAIALVTDYLGVKYDTGRKHKNIVVNEIKETIKNEKTALSYLNNLMKEDF